MNDAEVKALLASLAQIGAAVAAGAAPAPAASFALGAVLREIPTLFGVAAIILSKGGPSQAELDEAHRQALELLNPETIGQPTATQG